MAEGDCRRGRGRSCEGRVGGGARCGVANLRGECRATRARDGDGALRNGEWPGLRTVGQRGGGKAMDGASKNTNGE